MFEAEMGGIFSSNRLVNAVMTEIKIFRELSKRYSSHLEPQKICRNECEVRVKSIKYEVEPQ